MKKKADHIVKNTDNKAKTAPQNAEKTNHNSENTVTSDVLTVMRLSVRDFVAFAYRRGGLGSASYFSLMDGLGVKTHQQFFNMFKKSQPDSVFHIEYPLKTAHEQPPVRLEIQGRADLIVEPDPNHVQVIEVKTISRNQAAFPDRADFLHLAQARIYAYLFCHEKNLVSQNIQITIKYILVPAFKIKDFNETVSYPFLERFFLETCAHYLLIGKSIHDYEFLRDRSITDLSFPYPDLRMGQKEFMNTVLSTIRRREPLFVQAPTGIGKTVSTLYPAIKGIPRQFTDYIFYLTAKSSTQDVARKTLDDLRSGGLVLKSIQITAKEKLCLCRELYCETTLCPYAVSYYENYGDAMNSLAGHFSIDGALLQETGERYGVCPFELGLDASLFCDVIICDYNYIFDPKVQLERFIKEESYRFTLLVDEAHNLPDRANEMHSASITYKEFKEVLHFRIYFSPSLQESLNHWADYLDYLTSILTSGDCGDQPFDASIPIRDLFLSPGFCATRKLPEGLNKILRIFISNAKDEMDRIQDSVAKKALTSLYFSARFFIRISEEFFNDSYITTFSKESGGIEISLRCMDSAAFLARFHEGRHATVYFSATLSPIQYFESRFRDPKSNESIKKLILPSPFPRENLFVGMVPAISTKYANRRDSVEGIARVIIAAISSKIGNYLVYSPSFEYQQWIIQAFETLSRHLGQSEYTEDGKDSALKSCRMIRQIPGMSEEKRKAFLSEFSCFGERTLVGFAVTGGIFGEGIDLVGETLSGVVLVGVGLPGKSPERDIMMDYYSSVLGNGFDFAYRFPGFNRIQQAAGRVIRSENDRGFILLLDERYKTPEYQMLFPEDWDLVELTSIKQVKQALKEFLDD